MYTCTYVVKACAYSVTEQRAHQCVDRRALASARDSRSWNFINHFREDHPDWTSLPGLFLNAGSQAHTRGRTAVPRMHARTVASTP